MYNTQTRHNSISKKAHSPCRPLTETSVPELHTTDLTSYNLHWECTTPSSHLTPPRLRASLLTSQTSHRSPCISPLARDPALFSRVTSHCSHLPPVADTSAHVSLMSKLRPETLEFVHHTTAHNLLHQTYHSHSSACCMSAPVWRLRLTV